MLASRQPGRATGRHPLGAERDRRPTGLVGRCEPRPERAGRRGVDPDDARSVERDGGHRHALVRGESRSGDDGRLLLGERQARCSRGGCRDRGGHEYRRYQHDDTHGLNLPRKCDRQSCSAVQPASRPVTYITAIPARKPPITYAASESPPGAWRCDVAADLDDDLERGARGVAEEHDGQQVAREVAADPRADDRRRARRDREPGEAPSDGPDAAPRPPAPRSRAPR